MPRYYQFGGRPHHYEANWPGWPQQAVKTAPGSSLSGDLYGSLGDGATEAPSRPKPAGALAVLSSPTVRTIGAGAMAYHGYKRTRSGLWAVLWSVFGGAMPVLAVPISMAQGFGKPRQRKNPKKRKRLSTLAAYVPPQKKKKLAKKARLRTAAGRRRSEAAKKGWKKRRARERKKTT